MSLIFDPIDYVQKLEEVARTGNWTIRYLTPCASGTRPWLQRSVPEGTAQVGSLYISAGIHGDEISGSLAVLEMLRQPDFFAGFDMVIFPILNPDGLKARLRGNADGIDLNRDYRDTKSSEIAGHIEALKTLGRFDAAVMLHEDYEGIGAYLYELNETRMETGREMIAAMGKHVPIDLRPEIEEVAAEGGVILRKNLIATMGPIAERPEWPEAIYLSEHHTAISYTTESPMPFPIEQRVQAQIGAVKALMDSISGLKR